MLQPVDVSFREFAQRIHSECADEMSIDLHAVIRADDRGFCGEHGRIVPTWQGLCPICAGYVEIVDAETVSRRRRAWHELTGGFGLTLVEISAPKTRHVVPVWLPSSRFAA